MEGPLTDVSSAPLGPGLRVTSSLDADGCLRALGQTLLSFRVPEYTHLPSFTHVGWTWRADPDLPPEVVIICADRTGDDVVVALWPGRGGCRIGLFPLGGEASPAGPLDADGLAPRDTTLSGTSALSGAPRLSGASGGFGAGLISLGPPVLPAGYAEEMVASAGYRGSQRNTQIVLRTAGSLFLARAQQFIEPA